MAAGHRLPPSIAACANLRPTPGARSRCTPPISSMRKSLHRYLSSGDIDQVGLGASRPRTPGLNRGCPPVDRHVSVQAAPVSMGLHLQLARRNRTQVKGSTKHVEKRNQRSHGQRLAAFAALRVADPADPGHGRSQGSRRDRTRCRTRGGADGGGRRKIRGWTRARCLLHVLILPRRVPAALPTPAAKVPWLGGRWNHVPS